MANMLCSLPLLSNEPYVRQWKQQAGTKAAPAASAAASTKGGGSSVHANHWQTAAAADNAANPVQEKGAGDAAKSVTCSPQRSKAHGSHTLKSRNARLEVLLAASGALDLQVRRLKKILQTTHCKGSAQTTLAMMHMMLV
jgi:hypothetical protein